MIVVDAQMIATLLLKSEKTGVARAVYQRDSHWIAPVIWRSEFLQLLAYHVRKAVLTPRQANLVAQEAESLMLGNQYLIPAAAIFTVTGKNDCTAYAAEYAALAEEMNVPLVTLDTDYLRQFPGVALGADQFINLPTPNLTQAAETR